MDDMLPEAEMCAAMAADRGYRDFKVVEVVERPDVWEIRLDKPAQEWMSIPRALIARPRIGTELRLFGDGDGFPIRGVAVAWTFASVHFSGVYYRREALRCQCGDFGWNHPGGGPCKRSRLFDGTRETCSCNSYRPIGLRVDAPPPGPALKFPAHKCGLYLSHNEHRDAYEPLAAWLEHNADGFDFESEEAKQRSIDTDECWVLQWYPNSPVGFSAVAAPTLEECLAFALKED